MLSKEIEKATKVWDMKTISDKKHLAIETEFGSALVKDGEFGVVPKHGKLVVAATVRHECFEIREHHISSARICTSFIIIIRSKGADFNFRESSIRNGLEGRIKWGWVGGQTAAGRCMTRVTTISYFAFLFC